MHAQTPATLDDHSRRALIKTTKDRSSCRASPSLLSTGVIFSFACSIVINRAWLHRPSRWLLLVLTPFHSAPTALNVSTTLRFPENNVCHLCQAGLLLSDP